MPLINCPDCGQSVSDQAPTCIKCGRPLKQSVAKRQPPKHQGNASGAVFFLLICLGLWLWYEASSDDKAVASASQEAAKPAAPATPAQPVDFTDNDHYTKNQKVADAACKPSLACWADKHQIEAEVACTTAVEAKATYEVKWTTGVFHPMFSRVMWSKFPPGDDSVIYIGDEVEMQNQFGAFERMTYFCPYNVETQKVMAAVLQSGKLPAD